MLIYALVWLKAICSPYRCLHIPHSWFKNFQRPYLLLWNSPKDYLIIYLEPRTQRKCSLTLKRIKSRKTCASVAWPSAAERRVQLRFLLTHYVHQRHFKGCAVIWWHNIKGAGGMSEPTEGACQAYARSWCETHAPQGASANDNNDWPAGVRSTGAGRGDGGRRGEDLK